MSTKQARPGKARSKRTTRAPLTDGAALHIPLAEEELLAETHPIQRGVVHLHKSVEEQEQHIVLPVTTEMAQIERIPAAAFDATRYADPDVTIIPLFEERLVVRKEMVVTEYVLIHKHRTTQQETITDTVRHDVLTITPEPISPDDSPLVEINGDYETID